MEWWYLLFAIPVLLVIYWVVLIFLFKMILKNLLGLKDTALRILAGIAGFVMIIIGLVGVETIIATVLAVPLGVVLLIYAVGGPKAMSAIKQVLGFGKLFKR